MTRSRTRPTTTLVPLETFLVGAWIAMTLTAWLARTNVLRRLSSSAAPAESDVALRLDALLAFQIGLAETLLGAFLALLALRRHAHGLALLLPFLALTIALAFVLYVQPETARLLAAGRIAGASTFLKIAYGLEVTKVLVLFFGFFTLLRQHSVKRR